MSTPAVGLGKKIFSTIVFWVLLAIVLGTALGWADPTLAAQMSVLSEGFIWLIKLFIGPIIFLTLVTGISNVGDLKQVGRVGFKSLLYFELVSVFSLALGLLVAHLAQPGAVDIASLLAGDAGRYTQHPASESIDLISLIQHNTTLQILIASLVIGVVVNKLPYRAQVITRLLWIERWVFLALRWVMYLAPLAAFGGIASAVGKYGLATLIPLAKLVGSVYGTMILFVLCVLGPILRFYCRASLTKFLSYIKEELLLIWGTSSSESALPSLMQKLEQLGCSRSVTGLVVPTGYSFNLDGTSIYLSMSVVFMAQLFHIPLSFGEMLSILLILMITSKGAAGVTGSGFIVLASTLTAIHKIPLEGLAFLLSVDKFMSEARALTNIIGNGVATLVIAKSEHELHLNKIGIDQ